jgi:hypothetical protein
MRAMDAFLYIARGVYRTGETLHVTALLRDGIGIAALNAPLTLVVEGPDGVEYHRAVVPDQGLGGHSLDVPLANTALTGTWCVRAYSDPKLPPIGESTFLVEDYVPDRIEFDPSTKATSIGKSSFLELTIDGRYLYRAPAVAVSIGGEIGGEAAVKPVGFGDHLPNLNAKGRVTADELLDDAALDRIIAAPTKQLCSNREALRLDLVECLRDYILLEKFGRAGPANRGIDRLKRCRSYASKLVKLLKDDVADDAHIRELWSAHGGSYPDLLPQHELLLELLDKVSLERAQYDGSPLENLTGGLLPLVFRCHFGRPGVSRSLGGSGEPDGPYIRFAEQFCIEFGIKCKPETIVSAMKRLGANFPKK